jgi:hypothetical protein
VHSSHSVWLNNVLKLTSESQSNIAIPLSALEAGKFRQLQADGGLVVLPSCSPAVLLMAMDLGLQVFDQSYPLHSFELRNDFASAYLKTALVFILTIYLSQIFMKKYGSLEPQIRVDMYGRWCCWNSSWSASWRSHGSYGSYRSYRSSSWIATVGLGTVPPLQSVRTVLPHRSQVGLSLGAAPATRLCGGLLRCDFTVADCSTLDSGLFLQ